MKHILLLYILSLMAVWTNAQCLFENFYKFYPPLDWKTKTIATSDGGFVTVLGAYYDSLDPGGDHGQDMDMCIVKNDSCGNTLWKTHYGFPSEGDDAIDVVETESGDYLVTGYAAFQADGTIRIASFNRNGQLKWAKLYSKAITAIPYCMLKRKNKDAYIVAGDKQSGTSYVLEINDTGKVIREKALAGFNGAIMRMFELNDTSYLMVGAKSDSLFLIQTDTLFNIRWIKKLFNGVFGQIVRLHDGCLSYDGKSIALALHAPVLPAIVNDNIVVRVSLTGELIKYRVLEDSLPNLTYIISTSNNGYVIGSNALYTDSNFNYLRYYKYWGAALGSMVVNKTGYIIGSGISFIPDSVHAQLCIIGTDTLGNIIHSLINEITKEIEDFVIYPNPAIDKLHFVATHFKPLKFEIMSATGQIVSKGHFADERIIDVEQLSQGVYFLRVTDANGIVKTQRLLIN